jgi:hypothetical protein
MNPQAYLLNTTFSQMPTGVGWFWEALCQCLKEQQALPKVFLLSQLAGHERSQQSEEDLMLAPEEIAKIILARQLTAFSVNTGYAETSVAYLLHHNSFHCRVENNGKSVASWRTFVGQIATRFPTIGSWMPFGPYQGWQSVRSPDSYKRGTYGPLPPGFKTRYEPDKYGIGPGQTLFEDAFNPGRTKVVDHRCIFYPTAEMWLGPHFWQYAKCTKEEALAADFWLETRETAHFSYFRCWPMAFTRPDGEQGRMQQRLWKLFFHEDCEWPPGSGSICDEPLYGPPELMPP